MKEYFLLDDIPEYCAINRKGTAVSRRCFSSPSAVSQESLRAGSPGCPPRRNHWPPRLGTVLYRPLRLAACRPLLWRKRLPRRGMRNAGNSISAIWIPSAWLPIRSFRRRCFPKRKGLRADPYDNQVGECEIEGVGLYTTQFEYFHQMIDIHPVPCDFPEE